MIKKPKVCYQAIPEQENAWGPILLGLLAFLLINEAPDGQNFARTEIIFLSDEKFILKLQLRRKLCVVLSHWLPYAMTGYSQELSS